MKLCNLLIDPPEEISLLNSRDIEGQVRRDFEQRLERGGNLSLSCRSNSRKTSCRDSYGQTVWRARELRVCPHFF